MSLIELLLNKTQAVWWSRTHIRADSQSSLIEETALHLAFICSPIFIDLRAADKCSGLFPDLSDACWTFPWQNFFDSAMKNESGSVWPEANS